MNPPSSYPALLGFLRRRAVEVCAAIYLLGVIYWSLLPLEFSANAAGRNHRGLWLFGLPVVSASVPDALSNIALYLPLGALLCAALARNRMGWWPAPWPTLLAAAMLSYGLERCQIGLASRVASLADVVCNVIGAAAGAAMSRLLIALARRIARGLGRDVKEQPSLALVYGGTFGLFVLALAPFDVTYDIDRLRATAAAAHVAPFGKLAKLDSARRGVSQDGGFDGHHAASRDEWMLALDYGGWIGLYTGLALVSCHYLRVHCGLGVISTTGHVVAMAALLALVSSTLQVFIMSRGFDATVPLVQVAGALAGAVLHGVLWQLLDPRWIRRIAAAGLVAVALNVLLRQLAPFEFTGSAQSLAAKIGQIEWIPCTAYQRAKLPAAVDDIVHKLVRFAALGALAAVWFAKPAEGSRAQESQRANVGPGVFTAVSPGRAGLCVASAILVTEAAQLFLPSRTPGVTDVLLAGVGTAAGVYLYAMIAVWYHQVRAEAAPADPVRIQYWVELGPPEDVAAPKEGVPGSPQHTA